MTDKIDLPKAAVADEHSEAAASKMLQCTHKFESGVGKFGPWESTTVFEQGKSGDDYLANRMVNTKTGKVETYSAKPGDGNTYFDLIQPEGTRIPGEDTVMKSNVPQGQTFPEFKEGSPEYNAAFNLVHHQIDFNNCGMKDPLVVRPGEGYVQVVKRIAPELNDEGALKDAHRIKHNMGNRNVLKVGEQLKD